MWLIDDTILLLFVVEILILFIYSDEVLYSLFCYSDDIIILLTIVIVYTDLCMIRYSAEGYWRHCLRYIVIWWPVVCISNVCIINEMAVNVYSVYSSNDKW
jgi:hypothetical protein